MEGLRRFRVTLSKDNTLAFNVYVDAATECDAYNAGKAAFDRMAIEGLQPYNKKNVTITEIFPDEDGVYGL